MPLKKATVTRAPRLAVLQLTSIEDTVKVKYGYNPDDAAAPTEDAYLWTFTNGQVTLQFVTGINFGSPKSAFTKMVNGIEGKTVSADEFEGIDIESYIGSWYALSVQEKTTNDGEAYTALLGVKRSSAPANAKTPKTS